MAVPTLFAFPLAYCFERCSLFFVNGEIPSVLRGRINKRKGHLPINISFCQSIGHFEHNCDIHNNLSEIKITDLNILSL